MLPEDDEFTAIQEVPARRFWIVRDPPVTSNARVRGWSFVYDDMKDGEWAPGWDTWEEWFFEILRYLKEYASDELVWVRVSTGEAVNLVALQSIYDGKVVRPQERPESAGLKPQA